MEPTQIVKELVKRTKPDSDDPRATHEEVEAMIKRARPDDPEPPNVIHRFDLTATEEFWLKIILEDINHGRTATILRDFHPVVLGDHTVQFKSTRYPHPIFNQPATFKDPYFNFPQPIYRSRFRIAINQPLPGDAFTNDNCYYRWKNGFWGPLLVYRCADFPGGLVVVTNRRILQKYIIWLQMQFSEMGPAAYQAFYVCSYTIYKRDCFSGKGVGHLQTVSWYVKSPILEMHCDNEDMTHKINPKWDEMGFVVGKLVSKMEGVSGDPTKHHYLPIRQADLCVDFPVTQLQPHLLLKGSVVAHFNRTNSESSDSLAKFNFEEPLYW